jgi:Trk K+ transport system NAD-binding subunit
MRESALIFGYNNYASHIAKNISHKYKDIVVFKLESDGIKSELKDLETQIFDLGDEWGDLKNSFDMKNSIAFCVLEDDAENIFLTISLRAEFKDLNIIALSSNKESAHKLTMAGANKVIPLIQTTASMITEMLDKPIVTEVLHSILYEKSDLKVAQIKVGCSECFLKDNGEGKYPSEIKWSREHGIIVLSVIHKDGNSEFIYSSKSKHHVIENGDMFVVVGYEKDIKKFEKLIGGELCRLG